MSVCCVVSPVTGLVMSVILGPNSADIVLRFILRHVPILSCDKS